MENLSTLEKNIYSLSGEIIVLKKLRDKVDTTWGRQKESWLHNVQRVEHELDEIQKEFSELKAAPDKSNARLNLNNKVIRCLNDAELLKEAGNSNYTPIEKFISTMEREKPLRFSYQQIVLLTSNFQTKVDYDEWTDIYRGQIRDGIVAVKVLLSSAMCFKENEFMAEMITMGRTHHRNLAKLYGFCFDTRMKALVYEYSEKGSLEKKLYGNDRSLEWEKLYSIIIETAKGLSYLHENCHEEIIHQDLKPTNVILDENLSPKITGFGLANLHFRDLGISRPSFLMTRSFVAPEVSLGLPGITYKCDVFSFGMMLLAVLSGKRLAEDEGWFQNFWENFMKGQLDRIIMDCGIREKDMERARQLSLAALWCIQQSPKDRPSMSTVVKVLEGEIQPRSPPNPNPYMVFSIESNMSTDSTRVHRPLSLPASLIVDRTLDGEIQPRWPPGSISRKTFPNASEMNSGSTSIRTLPLSSSSIFNDAFEEAHSLRMQGVTISSAEGLESSESIDMFIGVWENEKLVRFSSRQLMTFTSNLKSKIGSGGFGDVYKGQFPDGMQVAIKVLKDGGMDVVEKQFISEVITIGKTYHRNLVKLYGFCFDGETKALIYEYMDNGSLDTILYKKQHSIEWVKLYSIAIEIGKALSYLHDNCLEQIIHFDIKAANVLLDSNLSPKVIDFGLAKLLDKDLDNVTHTGFVGTLGYAAPELWMGSSVITYKCDIFSFGMMLFEVLGRRKINDGQEWFPGIVWENFEKGQLDKLIENCGIGEADKERAETLSLVALWCIQEMPEDRPSMSTVVKVLEGQIHPRSPPNPFTYNVFSSSSSMSTGSTITSRPSDISASTAVFSAFDERLHEKRFLKEKEDFAL